MLLMLSEYSVLHLNHENMLMYYVCMYAYIIIIYNMYYYL